jgi:hypothetical protein
VLLLLWQHAVWPPVSCEACRTCTMSYMACPQLSCAPKQWPVGCGQQLAAQDDGYAMRTVMLLYKDQVCNEAGFILYAMMSLELRGNSCLLQTASSVTSCCTHAYTHSIHNVLAMLSWPG